MSRSHSEDVAKAHNDGQADASKGIHDTPIKVSLFVLDKSQAECDEINDAYEQGQAHHRAQTDDGGCFLTTACCTHAGLGDDCRELAVLRQFRDAYVASLPNGGDIIAEYYLVAPRIVEGITRSTHPALELERIYSVVTESVRLVESRRFPEAFSLYESLFQSLKQKYTRA